MYYNIIGYIVSVVRVHLGGEVMDEHKKTMIDRAWQKASYSYSMVYEAIGYIKGLVDGGVLEFSDVQEIDRFLIYDGLNNPEWAKKADI